MAVVFLSYLRTPAGTVGQVHEPMSACTQAHLYCSHLGERSTAVDATAVNKHKKEKALLC